MSTQAITPAVPERDTLTRSAAVVRVTSADSNGPRVSVLVPAKDEAENLPEFMRQCAETFAPHPGLFEVVVINDGSVDRTGHVLEQLQSQYDFLHVVQHRTRRGIADALRSGYLAARGD